MWQVLIQFTIIFSVLFESIQGNIDYLETKRHYAGSLNNINGFLDHSDTNTILKIHSEAATDPNLPRDRRQSGGNNPSAYSVTFVGDDSDSIKTIYSGEGSAVVYVLTYDVLTVLSRDYVISSGLYRSTNHGRTFSGQSSKFPQGFLLDSIVYKFPNSRAVIFIDANRPTIYVSTNEGLTFSAYNVTVNRRTMKVHPTTAGWLLGHDPSQGAIMYSQNYGASWAIVARNVHPSDYTGYSIADFVWGAPGIDWDVNNPRQSDITKVFYTVYDSSVSSSYNDRILYIANNPGSGYVNRVFDSSLGYFFYFQVDGGYIYAERVTSDDFELELYVSHMRNTFNLARIPSSSSHYGYLYGSHRSSQSLVIVRHDSGYNLYLSDVTGTYYTLSLEDLVGVNFRVDLRIISSINGTMMANQISTVSSVRRQQTVITFDNGATWQNIAAPANIDGAATNCMLPTCSLHLHMDTSTTYGHVDVYSTSSAPGIIVGHGNLGSYLTNSVSAYITRDGGLTWEQTLDSSWHIEIIDHGGLLVAAREYRRSDYYSRTIKYSCDEGMSWTDFDFSSTSLVVWGTNTEPGQTTARVLLAGTRTTSSSSSWVTVYIDFTNIFTRTCQSSDYYSWTVSNGRTGNQQCLLGETRIIERRRANVCCWNGRQYERLISTTPCQCTAADFECEWRYYRDNSGNCIWNSAYGQEIECSTGYRKIPGDACLGGVSNQYLIPNCGETTTSSTSSTGAGTTSNPTRGGDNGGSSGSQGSDNSSDSDDDSSSSTTIIAVIVVVVIIAIIAAVIIGAVIYRVKQHKEVTIPYHHGADNKQIVVVNTGQMNANNIASSS